MGGFSPPVPTPATTDTGIRTEALLETATSLVRDVDPDVLFEQPNDNPLLVITQAIKKTDTVTQRKFEMPFIPAYPQDLTVAADATAAATSFVCGAGEFSRLRRGHQLLNNRTGEVFTVAGTAEPTTTTITIAGRANAQAMVAGDTLRIIGSAHEENAEKPAIRTQREVYDYNYTQIFYEPWGVSFRDKNAKSYLGNDLALERRKAMQKFNRSREEVAIFGRRYLNSTGGYSNSSELTYTGGAAEFIKSNRWHLGGNRPTEDQFFEFLGEIFQYGEGGFSSSGGEARKIAFLSPAWFALIESWAKGRISYDNVTDAKRRIGFKAGFLQSSVGDLMLKLHPLFAQRPYRDKMLVLDLNQIKMVSHQGLESTVLENIQTPGSTRVEHGILADIGWKWMGDERAHGWVDGLGLAQS